MVIDFHIHGKITSVFPFDEEKFLSTINEAKENGLDSLAITEHCGANNFLDGYNFLNSNYNRIDDYYELNGFKIFYGMEVTTKQDLDILIIGKPELVLELRNKICASLNNEKHIDINDLFELNIHNELLVILAHPYRDHEQIPELKNNIRNRLDAVELNSKDLYKFGKKQMQEKVSKLADQLELPITSGSDSHHFMQVSTAKNIFNKDCDTVKEIKEEIKKGNYKIEFSTDLNVRVRSAIIIKKLICNK